MSTRLTARKTVTPAKSKAWGRQEFLLLLCALFLLSGCFGGGESSEKAYQRGKDDGYSAGHDDGYSVGYDDGYSVGNDDGYSAGNDDGYSAGHDDGYSAGHDDGYQLGREDGLLAAIPPTPVPTPVPTLTPEPELVTVTLSSQLYPDIYIEQMAEVVLDNEPEHLKVYTGKEKDEVTIELPEGFNCYNMKLDLTDKNGILEPPQQSSGGLIIGEGEEIKVAHGETEWILDNSAIVIADQLREGETKRVVHITIPYHDDVLYSLNKGELKTFEIPLSSNGIVEYAITAEVYDGTSPEPRIFEPNILSSVSITSGIMYQPELDGKSFVLKPSKLCDKAQGE